MTKRTHSSQFKEGHIPWNKGKHFSIKSRRKMSKAKKGIIPWNKGKTDCFNEETIKKMSKIKIGTFHSEKTKEKMRVAHLGKKYKSMSKKGKNNISKVMKGKVSPWKGKHASTKTRKKMSKAHIKYIANHPMLFSNTSIERKIKKQLFGGGISFIQQYNVNNRFACDFYLLGVNLIIEADGDYWHNRTEIIALDKRKNAYLEKCGYNLIRIPEHVINMDSFNVLELIGF